MLNIFVHRSLCFLPSFAFCDLIYFPTQTKTANYYKDYTYEPDDIHDCPFLSYTDCVTYAEFRNFTGPFVSVTTALISIFITICCARLHTMITLIVKTHFYYNRNKIIILKIKFINYILWVVYNF